MPPSKRAKKTNSAARASSSSHRPPPKDASLSNVDANEDGDADMDVSSPPTTESIKSNDAALFDEEEIPSEQEDGTTEAADKRRGVTYTGGYNALKSFKGQIYSGMAIGGSHTWNYDQGIWKETKEEPDLWKVDYKTAKRRARKAPTGSGAPVGTEYHWLIVAHQYVKKVDANTYETHLVGSKYKLAHKAASSNSWSIPTVKAQREREIDLLEDAKRRVQGLPPVLAGEKVKVEKSEKGQQKLDTLFAKAAVNKGQNAAADGKKRKRKEEDNEEGEYAEGE